MGTDPGDEERKALAGALAVLGALWQGDDCREFMRATGNKEDPSGTGLLPRGKILEECAKEGIPLPEPYRIRGVMPQAVEAFLEEIENDNRWVDKRHQMAFNVAARPGMAGPGV